MDSMELTRARIGIASLRQRFPLGTNNLNLTQRDLPLITESLSQLADAIAALEIRMDSLEQRSKIGSR